MMKKLADYYAGQALAGLTSDNPDGPYNPKLMAQLAWAISDAMMVQRGIRREQYDEDMSTTDRDTTPTTGEKSNGTYSTG